jgi:hypothetical protein
MRFSGVCVHLFYCVEFKLPFQPIDWCGWYSYRYKSGDKSGFDFWAELLPRMARGILQYVSENRVNRSACGFLKCRSLYFYFMQIAILIPWFPSCCRNVFEFFSLVCECVSYPGFWKFAALTSDDTLKLWADIAEKWPSSITTASARGLRSEAWWLYTKFMSLLRQILHWPGCHVTY